VSFTEKRVLVRFFAGVIIIFSCVFFFGLFFVSYVYNLRNKKPPSYFFGFILWYSERKSAVCLLLAFFLGSYKYAFLIFVL